MAALLPHLAYLREVLQVVADLGITGGNAFGSKAESLFDSSFWKRNLEFLY